MYSLVASTAYKGSVAAWPGTCILALYEDNTTTINLVLFILKLYIVWSSNFRVLWDAQVL